MATEWTEPTSTTSNFKEPPAGDSDGQGYGMQPYGSPAGSISGYGDPDPSSTQTSWTEGS